MSRANPYRGEVALDLDGRQFRLRPTFSAIVAAESALGPVFGLACRASEGEIALGDVVALFHACMVDAPADVASKDALGALVTEAGLARVLPSYRALLTAILDPGPHDDPAAP